ncbi:hypothetical protein SAMN05216347_102311 [Streptococcus equinus]|uniref:Tetratricopeptide repeat-containing protein n=1 Tax=Streptococcus equinus TaxID=1335 RepID=A0A1H0MEF0_STREI|nr:hypothetical protein [Streptococcus equinus]SDO78819.1 hypothetical protein SAMN05216347_102311 [Streptococcus equinus]
MGKSILSSFLGKNSLKKVERVQQLTKRVRYLYLLFISLFFISFIYSIESNTIFWIVLTSCLTPVVLISYAVFNNTLLKEIDSVLLIHLDLNTYLKILDSIDPEQEGRKSLFSKPSYYFRVALVYLLLGRINNAEKLLGKANDCLKGNKRIIINYYFLDSLIAIAKKDVHHFENAYNALLDFSKKYEAVKSVTRLVKAISNIERQNSDDYFDSLNSKNNLEKIVFDYYKAKNQLLTGNYEAAKENFQQIANENLELFYVREAKKYLEELDNE